MTGNIISLSNYRADRRPVDVALAAVNHHPKLKEADKEAIAALGHYATDAGYFDLDQRQRIEITGLSKIKLMSAVKRAKDADLLHKVDHSDLFRIGCEPDGDSAQDAKRLFGIRKGLERLADALEDTGTLPYEASWLCPKVARWEYLRPALNTQELVSAVRELGRLGYLSIAETTENQAGEALIRYEPRDDYSCRKMPHRPVGAA